MVIPTLSQSDFFYINTEVYNLVLFQGQIIWKYNHKVWINESYRSLAIGMPWYLGEGNARQIGKGQP